ncbi:hypothetical protein [Sulfuricurvum sp.]|uniref:hypothetical protein n=1 Tax=Sulfuricurvum sp. TaxID=2025608 RepID=UPI002614A5BA|nr:hypothetical protein [Sulfuricurvum sp.]MDD2779999.1 hypothetical protein [Sulfuricurvum sp.]
MNIKEVFEDFKIEDYLEQYQLSIINEMRQNGLDDDTIMQSFLEVPNQQSIQSFGGGNTISTITIQVIKKEFFDLLCGEKYADERQKIYDSKTQKLITIGITAKLATILTISQATIFPVIVLLLPLIKKFGCESYSSIQQELSRSE